MARRPRAGPIGEEKRDNATRPPQRLSDKASPNGTRDICRATAAAANETTRRSQQPRWALDWQRRAPISATQRHRPFAPQLLPWHRAAQAPGEGEAWGRHGGVSIAPRAPAPPRGSPTSPGPPVPTAPGTVSLLRGHTAAGPAAGRRLLSLARPPGSSPGASPALPQALGLVALPQRGPAPRSAAALAGPGPVQARHNRRSHLQTGGQSQRRSRSFPSGPAVSQWRGWERSWGIAC